MDNKDYMVHGPRKERGRVDQKFNKKKEKPTVVTTTQATPIASSIFSRLRYTGSEGQTLWKAAAAQFAGIISEAAVSSACMACQACHPRNPPAYFRIALADALDIDKTELSQMFASVRIGPNLPRSAPVVRNNPTPTFRRPPQAVDNSDAAQHERGRANAAVLARVQTQDDQTSGVWNRTRQSVRDRC